MDHNSINRVRFARNNSGRRGVVTKESTMPRNGRPFSASRIVPRSELPSRKVFRIPLFSACKRATFSRWGPGAGAGRAGRAEIKLYDVRADVLLPSAPLNPEPRNNLEVHDDDGRSRAEPAIVSHRGAPVTESSITLLPMNPSLLDLRNARHWTVTISIYRPKTRLSGD